jgi:hypothetical protein
LLWLSCARCHKSLEIFTCCIDYIEMHTQNYMLGKKDGEINHIISNYIKMIHFWKLRWFTKGHLMQLSTHASMTYQQSISTCNISIHLASGDTSSYMVKKLLNNLSYSYDIHFKFYFHHCVFSDVMNKTRSHLHIF